MNADPPGTHRTSARLTGYMALFLIFNAFVLNGAMWLSAPPPYKETVLQHTWDVLHARGCDDSWGIMSFSLEYAQAPHSTPLYTEIFFNKKLKFQYPPSSLFAMAAMLSLGGPEHVRTDGCQIFDMPTVNDILGWLFILVAAAASAALLESGLRQKQAMRSSGAVMAARAAVVLGLTLTFYPMVKAFTLGQIQLWINGVFGLALLCWAAEKRAASGLLIGLMCLIKPHYGLFLLWAALRREWRFTISCAATIAVGVVASIAVFGWANNVDYLQVFWFLSQRGETYYPNQSVNGLLNRLMSLVDPTTYNSIVFDDNTFPPFNPWVFGAVLLTSLTILSAALFRRGRDRDRVFDFCTMALSITMASPIAWEHHYGIVLPVFAVLLASTINDRRRLAWLVASYVMISNFIPATNLLALTVVNVVQSYLFAAAVVVLVLLHSYRPGREMAVVASLKSSTP